jgi:hypothetical protein
MHAARGAIHFEWRKSSSLGLTTTPSRGDRTATATTWAEATTTALASTSTLARGTTFHTTATARELSAVCGRTWATLLDVHGLTANVVRVSGNSSLVTGAVGELDESTVLETH